MKKPFVVYPFLFAIFPILFLFAHNRAELVQFSELPLPLAIALGSTLVLFLLCRLILKDSKKAGLIVSIFLILFFSYGHVYAGLSGWKIGGFSVGRHEYLMLGWGLLLVCGVYFVLRKKRDLDNFTSILNVVAASLVAMSLFTIGSYELRAGTTHANTGGRAGERAAISKDAGNAAVARDIYFIVLDGYAASSTLRDVYGYDNHEFTDYLGQKGFSVASEGRSSYAITYLSIASTLNMEYLNDFSDKVGTEAKNREITYELIRNSKVMNFLKSQGYKIVHFSSGWQETNYNEHADLNFNCGRGSEFQTLLLQTTLLGYFEQNLVEGDARKRILGTFDKLGKLPGMEGPKFVFAHILSPHPPYLFDANGDVVHGTELKMCGRVWLQKQNYLNQMQFINKKVEALIDDILSKSKVPPVIILQSDHGSASIVSQGHSSGWEHPSDEMLRERMRNLNACYLPPDSLSNPASKSKGLWQDSVTSVNTFRLIFNLYFDADYQLLNDQSYFSTYDRPYKFLNVTNKVKYDGE